MAKAEIKTQTIETTVMVQVPQVKTEVQQTGVKLDLTMAEAETLRTLLYVAVTGSTTKSPRKYLNRIEVALQDAGVLADKSHYKFSGYVNAVDYPSEKKAPQPTTRALQVGDKVRVVRKVTTKERGWDNCWVGAMDTSIGQLRTIKDIRSGGGYFEEVGMGFPPSALELIPKETLGSLLEKKLKAPKVGDKVRILPSGDHYLTIWPGYTGTVVEDKRPVDPKAGFRFVVVPDVVPVGGLQKYAYNFEDIEVLSS